MARFGVVATAMVTPFDSSGALDIDAAVGLARWLADNGNSGLVVAGTTGESPVLTDEERLQLIEAVCSAVTIPVVAGLTTNDTPHSVGLVRHAEALGAAGVLAVAPYYNRPPQAGLAAHFRAVAEATSLPVMLYDVPVRTGRKISSEVIVELCRDVSNIVALKDAGGNPAESAAVIAALGSSAEVYSGDDSLTLPLLAVGAVGLVGVATHWAGRETTAMVDAFFAGDVARAREINAALLASWAFETGDANPNPIPAKAMMRVLGHAVGQCRLPMGDAPAGLEDRARAVLADLRDASVVGAAA